MQRDPSLRERSLGKAVPGERELEKLRMDATSSFDRILAALIAVVQVASPLPKMESDHVSFVSRLMAEVFNDDVKSHKKDPGWRTINGFYVYCHDVYPNWASKDTFYKRMNECLLYLLSEGIVERRNARRRHGIGRAEFEYRISPDNAQTKHRTMPA